MEKGFNVTSAITIAALLTTGILIGWRVFESTIKSQNEQQLVLEPSVVEPSTEDRTTKISIARWGVTIPQSSSFELAVGDNFSSMAYGTDSENVKLFLPEFDSKFTCEADSSEPHKAVFATLVKFNGDVSGPYTSDKTVELDGNKYSLFKSGTNCYDQESADLINTFYNDYVANFRVERF